MEQIGDYLREEENLRCTWNAFPKNKVDRERFIVPVGFHYTPLKYVENLQILEYDPLQCLNCQSVLSPYNTIDFRSKFWECPFCMKKNIFPKHYADHISESTLPPECQNEYSTVEYKITKKGNAPHPIVFFVIDVSIDKEELMHMKEKIQNVLDGLPDDCMIGVLTFGTMANLLEVGFTDFTKFHTFKGDKTYSALDIQNILGISMKSNPKTSAKKFIQAKKDCAFSVSNFLDELSVDYFPKQPLERPYNCGGLALHIVITLLESISNGEPSRIEFFLGGAPNIGDGKVVSLLLKEPIRNIVDFQKNNDNIKYFKAANEYYNNLAIRALKSGQIIDIYSCSFNQVGLLEMKGCVEKTGGYMILADSFSHSSFKESFSKIFDLDENGNYRFGFKAKLEAFITKPYNFSGAYGYLTSIDLKAQKHMDMISKDVVGQGNTRVWNCGGINQSSTYSIILDNNDSTQAKRSICQLVTHYIAGDLTWRMRVTTFKRPVAGDFNSSLLEIAHSFDQEAATVMLAKICVDKGYKQEQIETLRWLDKIIIRLVTKFSEYKKDDVSSFKLNNRFNLFPQFMFYLRRSPFISDFNCSLDESIFYKSCLMNDTMINCTIMIQPILYVYTAEKPEATPVHLDVEHMKDNNVLFMDAFFFICIWHGNSVCEWRDQGLQDDPDYENIKNMLELPQESAQEIIMDRLPVPKYISCDSGNGQERYIKSTVNPSCSNSEQNTGVPEGWATDDISLKKFWDFLRKKIVAS